MHREPVRSSNVSSVGYDEHSQVLEVEFHTGAVYQYLGVPSSEFVALMRASSIGGYLNAHIKRRYRYRRIS
jgi:hypothetical protein